MPKVINLHKSRQREDVVYVGRPSPFGNPFRIGKDGTREEVVKKYRAYLMSNPQLLDAVKYLKGFDLACWCSPLPCHADVLLELANKEG